MWINVIKIMVGNGFAQMLRFIIIPVLSRIYQSDSFGQLAEVQSVSAFMLVFVTLQLHLTITFAQNDENAREALNDVVVTCVLACSVVGLIMLWLRPALIEAVILTLFLGCSTALSCYITHTGRFNVISIYHIARSFVVIVVQVVMGFMHVKKGLIFGVIVGEGLAAIIIYIYLKMPLVINLNFKRLANRIIKNKEFSLYGTIQESISVAAQYSPLLLFSLMFGKSVGGQYSMANQLVWAPVSLIASSYTQALYYEFSNYRSDKTIIQNRLKHSRLLLITLVALCICAFLFRELYVIVLGDQWKLCSHMIPWVLIWGVFFFLSVPYRVLYRVFLYQRTQLIIDFIFLASVILCFLLITKNVEMVLIVLVVLAIIQNTMLAKIIKRLVFSS